MLYFFSDLFFGISDNIIKKPDKKPTILPEIVVKLQSMVRKRSQKKELECDFSLHISLPFDQLHFQKICPISEP